MDLSNIEIVQSGKHALIVRRMADELMVQRIISKHATPNYLGQGYCLIAALKIGETLEEFKERMERFEANQLQKRRRKRGSVS